MRIFAAFIFLFPLLVFGDVSDFHPYKKEILEWQKFYKEQFGIQRNLFSIGIPKSRLGFNKLLIILPDLKSEQVFNRIEKVLNVKSEFVNSECAEFKNLVSEPRFSKSYAVWVRDCVESDLSIAPDNPDKLLIITLEERLIFELKYFLNSVDKFQITCLTPSLLA